MRLPGPAWLRRIVSPASLRAQLLARSLFILATLLLLIGGVQYLVMKNFLYNSRAETMENQLRSMPVDLLVKREQQKQPPNQNQTRNYRPILFTPTDTSLGYIQEDGSYVSLTQSTETGYPVLSASEYESILKQWKSREKIKYRIVRDSRGNDQLVVFRPADSPVIPGRGGFGGAPEGGGSTEGERITGLVQMGTETGPLVDVAMRQLVIFLVLSLLAMAGGLLLYMPLIRRTLVPLNQIIRAVAATDAGNLKQRVPEQLGQEEIDRLSSSFNGMLERLELSFEAEREAKEQMRRFTADASHELRTPLTSIHGFLEVLLRSSSLRPEQLTSALNSMHGESIRMKKLIEDLLMLAKLDRAPELTLTGTFLDELVQEMKPHLRILSGQREVSFSLAPGLQGYVDKDKLKQVVLNLFQNAVQHTDPETGTIHVGLRRSGQEAVLSVSDNGPGIEEEHLPHVFERFYRSDVSRARKRGGAGLGLAISLSMVEAHGGTIKVQTRVGEGTTFSVHLPL
ncbi:hypothetical protein AWM70_05980 [Paenibacillus yonginensis]|uniref:histidine kinase n=1 Tax=Paenibacillus yonginensis TaxID=1462996 RepID=A0A1B1MYE7_9BACL|nr:HAMP domain-containing sensor histidine kinase [Paenibacillus yonginensis]ANS74186.1 hypothetical protein AWM70_05980 [Paenibacillus yonginensis]